MLRNILKRGAMCNYRWSHICTRWVFLLTHWGRVTHICVSKLSIIGSDNGLSPDRLQAIIWTNAGILLIGPLGTNFSDILIEFLAFWFKKMRLNVSSAKWRPFCLGLNVLRWIGLYNDRCPWKFGRIQTNFHGFERQYISRYLNNRDDTLIAERLEWLLPAIHQNLLCGTWQNILQR